LSEGRRDARQRTVFAELAELELVPREVAFEYLASDRN